jgi:hypothetical protein
VNRKEPQTPIRKGRRIKQNAAVKECEGKGEKSEQNECVAVCDVQIDGWLSTTTLIWWLALEGLDPSFVCMYCVSSRTTYIGASTSVPKMPKMEVHTDAAMMMAKEGCGFYRVPSGGIGQASFSLRPWDWSTTTLKQ